MLHTCAVHFADFLYERCSLPASRRSVYIYGSELFFSTSLSIISILLISFLIGKLISGILFVVIFVSLRMYVGGFHATTYRHCFLLTNGVFLITLGGSILLEDCGPSIQVLILIFSIGVIWSLAPIRNIHHSLSEKTYQKNKKIGRVLIVMEGIASIFAFFMLENFAALSISIASITAVAVMMIVPKLAERRVYHG